MRKYPKIRQLGTAETQGILDGPVEVTEKLDGANCRFSLIDGELFVGSRNNHVPVNGEGFMSGLGEWAFEHKDALIQALTEVKELMSNVDGIVIVGEWMKKHTINYGISQPYVIFYDAFIRHGPEGNDPEATYTFMKSSDRLVILSTLTELGFKVNIPLFHGEVSVDDIKTKYMDLPSRVNPDVTMEGIVLKRHDFINRFGRQCHAKVLNEAFLERKDTGSKPKARKFDGAGVVGYGETVHEFVTENRIRKLCDANGLDYDIRSMKELIHLVPDDILSEEILVINKRYEVLNFKEFNRQVCARVAILLNRPF